MAEPEDVLTGWSTDIDSLSRLSVEMMEAAAVDIERDIRKHAGSGQAPDGTPWAPKKRGGGQALKGSPGAVNVVAFKTHIIAVVKFPYSLHHWGIANRVDAKRRIIPDKSDSGWKIIMVQNGIGTFKRLMKRAEVSRG